MMNSSRINWKISANKKMSMSTSMYMIPTRTTHQAFSSSKSKSLSSSTVSSGHCSMNSVANSATHRQPRMMNCSMVVPKKNNQDRRDKSKTKSRPKSKEIAGEVNGGCESASKATEKKDHKDIKDDKEKVAKLKREYKAELSRAKRAKYSTASMSATNVLKDLRNSATRGMSSMKTSFDNLLSQKLRITSPKGYESAQCIYSELENEPRTPLKMYSPFGIESPAPKTMSMSISDNQGFNQPPKRRFGRTITQKQVQPLNSLRTQLVFASPTGKIKEDIRSITNSLNELSMISADIQYKFSISNSPSTFSISTQ